MDSEKILCKVIIRNGTSKNCSITGEVGIVQLESHDCDWITVENAVFGKFKCNFIELVIYKADIEKIVVFKPNEEITFNRNECGFIENIQFL